jgi:hypothetical protein
MHEPSLRVLAAVDEVLSLPLEDHAVRLKCYCAALESPSMGMVCPEIDLAVSEARNSASAAIGTLVPQPAQRGTKGKDRGGRACGR